MHFILFKGKKKDKIVVLGFLIRISDKFHSICVILVRIYFS